MAGMAAVDTTTVGSEGAATRIAIIDPLTGAPQRVRPSHERQFNAGRLETDNDSPGEQRSIMDQKKPLTRLSEIRASGPPNSPAAARMVSFEHLSDQSVQRLYEGIRHQVEADRAMDGRCRRVGEAVKQRAQLLRAELLQRGLKFAEIEW